MPPTTGDGNAPSASDEICLCMVKTTQREDELRVSGVHSTSSDSSDGRSQRAVSRRASLRQQHGSEPRVH